jgi:hypothetical protein
VPRNPYGVARAHDHEGFAARRSGRRRRTARS